MRELVLASLRIDLKELHLDVVALLDTSLLNGLQALPSNLRDVEQTLLARHNLYEAAVRHDALHNAVVHLAHLRDGHDGTNLLDGSVDRLLVGSAHLHVAYAISLIDGDG